MSFQRISISAAELGYLHYPLGGIGYRDDRAPDRHNRLPINILDFWEAGRGVPNYSHSSIILAFSVERVTNGYLARVTTSASTNVYVFETMPKVLDFIDEHMGELRDKKEDDRGKA